MAGCSDDGGATATDDTAATGSANDGSADDGSADDGSAGSDGSCGFPGATELVAPRMYGDGSVIVRMHADGDTLFYGTLDEIYSVPIAGGEPTLVYPPEPEVLIYPPFWIRGDDLVVLRGDTLEVLPKTGGAVADVRTLPVSPTVSLNGNAFIFLDDDARTFYGKQDEIEILDDEPQITYFKYDIETDTSQILLADSTIGDGKNMVKAGDWLYTAHPLGDPTDPADDTPDELYRIPVTGGSPELVPVEGNFLLQVVGADETHLFVADAQLGGEAADFGGVSRMSHDGGSLERLFDHPLAVTQIFSRVVSLPDSVLFWYLGDFYTAPHGTGETTRIYTSPCEIHTIEATATDLFVSVFDADAGEVASILRVPR